MAQLDKEVRTYLYNAGAASCCLSWEAPYARPLECYSCASGRLQFADSRVHVTGCRLTSVASLAVKIPCPQQPREADFHPQGLRYTWVA
jgi:hypothetical protein